MFLSLLFFGLVVSSGKLQKHLPSEKEGRNTPTTLKGRREGEEGS